MNEIQEVQPVEMDETTLRQIVGGDDDSNLGLKMGAPCW